MPPKIQEPTGLVIAPAKTRRGKTSSLANLTPEELAEHKKQVAQAYRKKPEVIKKREEAAKKKKEEEKDPSVKAQHQYENYIKRLSAGIRCKTLHVVDSSIDPKKEWCWCGKHKMKKEDNIYIDWNLNENRPNNPSQKLKDKMDDNLDDLLTALRVSLDDKTKYADWHKRYKILWQNKNSWSYGVNEVTNQMNNLDITNEPSQSTEQIVEENEQEERFEDANDSEESKEEIAPMEPIEQNILMQ